MRQLRGLAALVAAMLVIVGCSDDPKVDQPICSPGDKQKCTCANKGEGTQICDADGLAWGTCSDCKALTDGGPDSAPPTDGGKDGQPDAFAGDGPHPDQATSDSTPGDLVSTGDSYTGSHSWRAIPSGTTETLNAVWGSSAAQVFAVGAGGKVLRFTGRMASSGPAWASMGSSSSSVLHGVWGSGARDVFAAGEHGAVVRFNGLSWGAQTTGTTKNYRWIWGGGFASVYAMGEFGTLAHNVRSTSPNTWTALKPGSKATLLGAWGASAKQVFVVGSGGAALYYDGSVWKTLSSGTTKHLWAVWGSGVNNVFAVGQSGTILRFNGTSFKAMASGTTDALYGVWGSGPADVYAVGQYGTILHYDGKAWSKMSSGTKMGLRGVWGSAGSNVFAVGEAGTILRYGPCACKVGAACYQAGERDATGCQVCAPGKSTTSLIPAGNVCKVGATCYNSGEQDPAQCKACDPLKSTTSLTALAGRCAIQGKCYTKGQQGETACSQCDPAKSVSAWSSIGGTCQIGGACYTKGTKDSTGCKVCDPAKSGVAWTVIPNMCLIGGKCLPAGTKDSSAACRVCTPASSSTSWTVTAGQCYIGGKCMASGAKDSSGCQSCAPAKSATSWSPLPGKCYIDFKCYANGAKDTSGCQICDITKSTTSWTVVGGKCFIGGQCLANGAKDSGGCRVCDLSKSSNSWTMLPGKCFISNQCFAGGYKDPTGCQSCDPAKTATSWTPVACSLNSLPPKKVTFAHGTSTSQMTLATINTNGTGYAKVPGLGTLYFNYYSYLYGRTREYYPFTRHGPQQLSNLPYYPIALGGNKGRIRYFREQSPSGYQVGVLLSRGNGQSEVLYKTPGSSTSSLYYYFAVSDDGNFVASHRPKKGLVLMRTDSKKYTSGLPYIELDLPVPPYYIYPSSVTVTNKSVLMITRASSSYSSQHTLWIAPVDGSKPLAPVKLPLVGGQPPKWIDDEIAFSADGTIAVVTAGAYTSSSYSTKEDVIAVNAAGKAVNVSKDPNRYMERYSTWGYYSYPANLAVSPKGGRVAYAEYLSSSSYDIYVSNTTGTNKKHVTSPANVSSSTKRIHNLRWVDEDNLIFTAYGSSSSYNDIYRWHAPSSTLSNVTGKSSKTKPFSFCCGYHRIYGMWMSPNGKYLYYISYTQGSPIYPRDIKGVDLTTWKLVDVTSGLDAYASSDAYAACPGGSMMFFSARPKGVTTSRYQVMAFDMNKPAPAVQLTNMKPPAGYNYTYNYDLKASPDCKYVAFRAGYSSRLDLYTARVQQPMLVSNLSNKGFKGASNYIYDDVGFSQDSQQVVYFDGYPSNKFSMRMASIAMGPCCTAKTIYNGPGSYNYWMIFGVK